MDILICIIMIITAIYAEFVIYKMSVLKQKLIGKKTDAKCIDSIICNTKQKVQNADFNYGDYYAYNPLKKEIKYQKKVQYSFYDLWGMNHEIGHLYDDGNNIILRYTIVKAIEKMLLLPIFVMICVFNILYKFFFANIIVIVGIMILILAFIHLYFIYKYEKSASNYAFLEMEKFGEISLCKLYANYCIKQQILLEILEQQFVLLLIVIVITK